MKNPLKGLGERVERWLMKEEYAAAAAEQAAQLPTGPNGEKITPEQLNVLLAELKKVVEENSAKAKEQFDLCSAEDHSQPPSQVDIDRYFGYHDNFTSNMRLAQEKIGMWTVSDTETFTKEEYQVKAQSDGWEFLRRSCGLPQGKMGGTPWKTTGEGWKAEEL